MESAEVLKQYSVELLSLPVDQPVFIGLLNKQNLLPGNTKAKITTLCRQQTKEDAAQYLVDQIESSLAISDDSFDKLISVMKQYKHGGMEKLANEMQSAVVCSNPSGQKSKSAATGTTSVKMQSSLSQVKIFISYAWEDTTNNFVIKLKRDMEAAGLKVFLDKHEILPGDMIQHEVAKGMEEADGIIIVYSERYPNSYWCDKELQMAQNRRKKIFPVRRIKNPYEKNVDLAIGGIRYADFIDDDNGYQDSLTLLIRGIEKNCVKKT